MKKRILYFSLTIFLIMLNIIKVNAQNIGINSTGANPHNSAMLDIDVSALASKKGLLIPRLALTGTNDTTTITSPATSLLIYNTATAGTSQNNVVPGYYYWNGSKWFSLSGNNGGHAWSLTGNSGTDSINNFIGNTDNLPITFKTNNSPRMILSSKGYLGLHNFNPKFDLHAFVDSGFVFETQNLKSVSQFSAYLTSDSTQFTCSPSGLYTVILPHQVKNYFIWKTSTNSLHIGSFEGSTYSSNKLAVNSVAIGHNPVAGSNSIAIGDKPIAGGNYCIALGYYSKALGYSSLVLQSGFADTSAINAIVLGRSYVNGIEGISIGSNYILRDYGIGIGKKNKIKGKNALCIGDFLAANADSSYVIGMGFFDNYSSNCSPLTNNIKKSIVFGMNSNIPTLFIGPSDGNGTTGKIGIGTTNPSTQLEIKAPAGLTSWDGLRISNSNYTLANLGQGGLNEGLLDLFANGVRKVMISPVAQSFIDAGYFGIGTQTPNAMLEISASGGAQDLFMINSNDGLNGNRLVVKNSGSVGIGTTTTPAKLTLLGNTSNSTIPSILSTAILRIGVSSNEGLDIGKMGSGSFAAWIQSGYNNFADPLVLQPLGGNLGIGTTSPLYQLQLSLDQAAKPSTNTWTIASDERLKKEISPFTDGLNIILQINPVKYKYNGIANMPTDIENIGIIAQDMQKIAPYTVGTFKYVENSSQDRNDPQKVTEYLSFNSHALTFVTINAIKEQQKLIEDLKKTVENQQKQIDKLLNH